VLANDTLSVDRPNELSEVTFGKETRSFDKPDGQDGHGAYLLVDGDYGTLKIYANGDYNYIHDDGAGLEVFSYKVVDFDGDASTATLSVQVTDNGPGEAPTVKEVLDETYDLGAPEKGQFNVAGATHYGLGEADGDLGFTFGGSAGKQLTSHGDVVTVALKNGYWVGFIRGGGVDIPVFTLTVNDKGQYVFHQYKPLDHADGSNPNDVIDLNFTYAAYDAHGQASEGTLTVCIKDDAPVAVNDSAVAHHNGPVFL